MNPSAYVDPAYLADFCRRWKVDRLEVFGSVARGEERPDSDLDLLVTFSPDADWGLFEHARLEAELSDVVGRKVELVSRRAIERSSNPYRRHLILGEARPFYAA